MKKESQKKKNEYFVSAKSWTDDLLTQEIITKNHYKLAFYLTLLLSLMLALIIIIILPLEKVKPFIVHHYENGLVNIEPLTTDNSPNNRALLESELVRYVTARESYDSFSYQVQYSLVNLLSNDTVANEYIEEQSASNKNSFINLFGTNTIRQVHIESILFLDSSLKNKTDKHNKKHVNLAEVSFTTITIHKDTNIKTITPFTALISWQHNNPSENPEQKWQNWDGLCITKYTVAKRNV